MPEPIAAALLRHIARLRILQPRATVALPIRLPAIRLHATPLHLRIIAVHRRRNPPALVTMVEYLVGAAAAMVEAEVLEAAVAAVVREAVLRAGVLPEALRAAART